MTVVRVANAQGVSESRPQDEINAAITQPSKLGQVDVWLLSEIAWADLEGIAKKHSLHALHYGERGSAEAGVGILSREPIKKPLFRVGSLAARGVRLRPLVKAKTCGLWVTAAHAPPKRNPVARLAYLARVRATGGLVGGDMNTSNAEMRRRFKHRTYRGIGVLGLLVPSRFKTSSAHGVNIGSDHKAVDVRVAK